MPIVNVIVSATASSNIASSHDQTEYNAIKSRAADGKSIVSERQARTRMDETDQLQATGQRIITRDQLYNDIWAEPATKVSARYGVSGSFLARVCDRLNVPRPQPGYWAKHAVGKAPAQPALPEAKPGDEVEWTPGGGLPASPRRPLRLSRTATTRSNPTPKKPASISRPATHPLIGGAIGLIPVGRVSDEGYYRPNKKLLPDIIVTEKTLESGLKLANRFYRILESRGHHVRIAVESEQLNRVAINPHETPKSENQGSNLWTPYRPTVVYIDTVAIGLSIFEMCEDVEMQYLNGDYVPVSEVIAKKTNLRNQFTWTTVKPRPSGRFCIQAFSPYQGTDWKRQWRDMPGNKVSGQLEEIATALEAQTAAIVELVEEAERQARIREEEWQAQRERWRREEQAKRQAKAYDDAQAELLSIINDWNEAERITTFFEAALLKASEVSDEFRTEIENRLAQAQSIIGAKDPLERLAKWKSPEERYKVPSISVRDE